MVKLGKPKLPGSPPKGGSWYPGERYDIMLGNMALKGGDRTRVDVWVRDNTTGEIIKRVGDGRQIGNMHPVTINWKGKKVDVENMLKKKR